MRHERERGGSPLHPVVRVRASRQGQLPEPPSSPSLGSVVAVGRQCLNVLVFLPELLFPARRERRAGAGGRGRDEDVVVKSQPWISNLSSLSRNFAIQYAHAHH